MTDIIIIREFQKEQNNKSIINIMNKFIERGYSDDLLEGIDKNGIEHIILSLAPNSKKAIITISYALSLYAKYTKNDYACRMIRDVSKDDLWDKYKGNSDKKYFSYNEYRRVIKDIKEYEEMNALYCCSLLECIYEGIYNNDLTVLRDLRGRDVVGNEVKLKSEGKTYSIGISNSLISGLLELADVNVWERKNRYGYFENKTIGIYPDSCFKIIEKKGYDEDSSYRFAYYSKIRQITEEYFGKQKKPQEIFVSGIMHRIAIKLREIGIDLVEAFELDNRNRSVHEVIREELDRCNYNIKVNAFRQQVQGHIESFILDDSYDEEHIKKLSMNELLEKARKREFKSGKTATVQNEKVIRDPYVAEYAKRRANGICQLCNKAAPFINSKTGEAYLEVHHIIWLSNGGDDTVENTVALCPNCHRKMHYVNDENDVALLKNKASI